jgi:hypothetical protein
MENLENILHKLGYNSLKDLGLEYQTRPLYRDSDNNTALVIRKSDGVFYDFVERFGGSLEYLIQLTLKTTPEESKKLLEDNNIVINSVSETETFIKQQKIFDKEMLNRLIKDHSYWIGRGISKEIIEQFGGGITYNGRMAGRYVVPIFNSKEQLVGFTGRSLNDDEKYVKWKLYGQKSAWIFPAHLNKRDIIKSKKVILVESFGDAASLMEIGVKNVLVLWGVVLSPKIIQFLLKLDIQEIIVSLNDDSDKNFIGNAAAQEVRRELEKYFDSEQIRVVVPKYNDYNEWLCKDRSGLEVFAKENLI